MEWPSSSRRKVRKAHCISSVLNFGSRRLSWTEEKCLPVHETYLCDVLEEKQNRPCKDSKPASEPIIQHRFLACRMPLNSTRSGVKGSKSHEQTQSSAFPFRIDARCYGVLCAKTNGRTVHALLSCGSRTGQFLGDAICLRSWPFLWRLHRRRWQAPSTRTSVRANMTASHCQGSVADIHHYILEGGASWVKGLGSGAIYELQGVWAVGVGLFA